MSGFPKDAVDARGALTEQGEFLPKPFDAAALNRAVRRAANARWHVPQPIASGEGH